MLAALFVRQSVDRIFLGSFERRVDGAEHRTNDGDERGFHDPIWRHLNAHQREFVEDSGAGCIAERESGENATDGEDERFAKDDIHDIELAGPERLEDADLASTLHYGGVHR